jgi:hypothetical protein
VALSNSESIDVDVGRSNENMNCVPNLAGACSSNEPNLLTQGDLNDIVYDLKVSNGQTEIFGSRLKGWNLLRQDT